jgi:hypothetical protein
MPGGDRPWALEVPPLRRTSHDPRAPSGTPPAHRLVTRRVLTSPGSRRRRCSRRARGREGPADRRHRSSGVLSPVGTPREPHRSTWNASSRPARASGGGWMWPAEDVGPRTRDRGAGREPAWGGCETAARRKDDPAHGLEPDTRRHRGRTGDHVRGLVLRGDGGCQLRAPLRTAGALDSLRAAAKIVEPRRPTWGGRGHQETGQRV